METETEYKTVNINEEHGQLFKLKSIKKKKRNPCKTL